MKLSKARITGFAILAVTALLVFVFFNRERRLRREKRPLEIVEFSERAPAKDLASKKSEAVDSAPESDAVLGPDGGKTPDRGARAEKSTPCFVFKYYHRAIAAHEDGEACLAHDNALAVSDPDVDPGSVCVRVNGVPVGHRLAREGSRAEVRIGPVAGPHAEVTLSYCTGKYRCDRHCEVPKDEFIEGLTASNEEQGDDSWEATADPGSQESAAFEAEAKEFRSIAAELSQAGQHELFRDWVVFEEQVRACKTKIVKN